MQTNCSLVSEDNLKAGIVRRTPQLQMSHKAREHIQLGLHNIGSGENLDVWVVQSSRISKWYCSISKSGDVWLEVNAGSKINRVPKSNSSQHLSHLKMFWIHDLRCTMHVKWSNASPVPELSFLPAPYRGWSQENLHAHAENEAIKNH